MDKFTCDAHEANAVYMIVAVLLQTVVPTGTCDPQVESFLLLADVLDLLMCVKSDIVDLDRLKTAIVAHVLRFLEAYGGLGWLVKRHLAIDLADALERFLEIVVVACTRTKTPGDEAVEQRQLWGCSVSNGGC